MRLPEATCAARLVAVRRVACARRAVNPTRRHLHHYSVGVCARGTRSCTSAPRRRDRSGDTRIDILRSASADHLLVSVAIVGCTPVQTPSAWSRSVSDHPAAVQHWPWKIAPGSFRRRVLANVEHVVCASVMGPADAGFVELGSTRALRGDLVVASCTNGDDLVGRGRGERHGEPSLVAPRSSVNSQLAGPLSTPPQSLANVTGQHPETAAS